MFLSTSNPTTIVASLTAEDEKRPSRRGSSRHVGNRPLRRRSQCEKGRDHVRARFFVFFADGEDVEYSVFTDDGDDQFLRNYTARTRDFGILR